MSQQTTQATKNGINGVSDYKLEEQNHTKRKPKTVLQRLSRAVTLSLENFFYRWGVAVSLHPWKFITICILLATLCATGFVKFREEKTPDKLILPRSSEYAKNTEWIRSQVPIPIRENYASISAENVLTPEIFIKLIDLHETINAVSSKSGKTWKDVCFRAPITKFDLEDEETLRRRKRSESQEILTTNAPEIEKNFFSDEDNDFFNEVEEPKNSTKATKWGTYHAMSESLYCSIIDALDDACLEFNPVEMWSFDKSKIYNLTSEEIVRVLNHEIVSPIFGRKTNYKMELGGELKRNDKGEIISAQAVLIKWVASVELGGELVTDSQGLVVDISVLEWEHAWIKGMKKFAKELPKGVKLSFANASSWGDILDDTLIQEGIILMCGFIIMFCYVGLMLGRMNMVEQRPVLTSAGLFSIALALIASCGIGTWINWPFMTLNRVLPFLILGIGIDDIFVICQCWNNLYPSPLTTKSRLGIPERVGRTMRHAGVSVTVTSLTDIVAFLAGSLTEIPSLRSFCLYAALGIAFLFFFQCTLFVAVFAIDQQRLEERRNSFFFWIKYSEEKVITSTSAKTGYTQIFFDKFLSKYLLKTPSKATVIVATLGLLGAGIYGNILLRQHSDPMWFIPEDSYLVEFYRTHLKNYPDVGFPALVFTNEVNWTQSLQEFGTFIEELERSPHLHDMMQFYTSFKEFVMAEYSIDVSQHRLDQQSFNKYMGRYLYSPYGAAQKYFFKVNGSFSCGDSLPPIESTITPFRFKFFHSGSEEHIPAMHKIKNLVQSTNITFNDNPKTEPKFFFWAQIALAWEVDEIIKGEMYKNLGLSLSCVMIVTALLLANFKMCLLCGICVVFTVIDVSGIMHFWNLTIDSASCTTLVLAVGLCVDYAAHICLAFMSAKGSKNKRAQEALSKMGPAVFNGGFSTFLGVVLLSNARTYAAFSFFKIFTLVVGFGLFHGLIFLPVLLSLFGSDPVDSEEEEGKRVIEEKSQEMQTLANGHAKGVVINVEKQFDPNASLQPNDPLLSKSGMD